MADNINNRTLGWDDTITQDSQEFIIVPEGKFAFQVTNFERARYEGSEKMPPCNKAVITLKVKVSQADGTSKFANVFVNFFLLGSMEWKISEFFISVGMKKRGEALHMDWPGTVGKKGYALFNPRTYKNKMLEDVTVSNVARFLDYDEKNFAGNDPDTWGMEPSSFTDVTATVDDLPF